MIPKTLVKKDRWLLNASVTPSPTLLVAAGMHGNELKGVAALTQWVNQIKQPMLKGSVHCFLGNLKAQEMGVRFVHQDLNRVWPINDEKSPKFPDNEDGNEAKQIAKELKSLLKSNTPLHFVDLHTTSALSVPFIITDEKQACTDFARQFPVPVVIGLPKFIPGTLLQWFNNLGHVGIAFEAGQHDEPASERKHFALLQLLLHYQGMQLLNQRNLEDYQLELSAPKDLQAVFKLVYRHEIKGKFEMKPGYKNFQPVAKGEIIATEDQKPLMCPLNGFMFMPLYQRHGDDGFFIIEKIA